MNKLRFARLSLAAVFMALLTACAGHPMAIGAVELPPPESATVNKKVAYVITDADRALAVETPGGGGDMLRYYPYRDMEKAVRAALRAVYTDVTVLGSPGEAAASGAAYVFTPRITTNSSSPSSFTWPPTRFSAEVTCTVTQSHGAPVSTVKVTGSGVAEYSEFSRNGPAVAARRAVEDASRKLAAAIRADEKLR